jgi:hypothetical protein
MKMKFKDLKIGQKFTRKGWNAVDIKIYERTECVMGGILQHKEVNPPTGISANRVKDDDEVILVED